MRKILLINSLLLAISFQVVAQFVSIPDSSFRANLKRDYPSCFNSNEQFDTTCNKIPMIQKISYTYKRIKNLSGIEYLDSLKVLHIGGNPLETTPKLPAEVRILNYNNIKTTPLPIITAKMTHLYISFCNLTQLPNLPPNLTLLSCVGNQLTTLNSLPASLVSLSCSNNKLTSLPKISHTKLEYLACTNNEIASLPALPDTLNVLWVSSNEISELPTLPRNLLKLLANENKIKTYPNLPNRITQVELSSNLITEVGNIPSSLTSFKISYNCLSSFPTNPFPSTLTTFSVLPNNPNCETVTAFEETSFSTENFVYPNPTSEKIMVVSEEQSTFKLYSATGQLLLEQKIINSTEINVSSFSTGIYHYTLGSKKGKLIIH